MARILVCADGFFRAFSPISLEPYIQMFIDALVENGNDVMPYITKDIIHKRSNLKTVMRMNAAYQDVKNFNPEIIFSFNNAIDERFLKFDCPVYVIASDTPIYWNNQNLIKENPERYNVLYLNDDFASELKETYKIGYDRQFKIPYTTDIKAHNVPQDKDITFIGNFYISMYFNMYEDFLKKYDIKHMTFLKKIFKILSQGGEITDDLYEEYLSLNTRCKFPKNMLRQFFCTIQTNNIRYSYLKEIKDLDLHIYTFIGDFQCMDFDYNLFEKCHFEKICSAKDNESVYNSSKISLSLPHGQIITGFSWRVCDILASNSMLLTFPGKDMTTLFGNLIPTYKDEKDLREKCLYYLSHEDERLDIVKQSQELIEKNHKEIILLKMIEEYSGMKLIKVKANGSIKNIRRTEKSQKRYYRKQGLKV